MIERHDEPKYPIDALALLKADHQLVHDLFTQYESAADFSTKQMLAEQVFTALDVHAQLEENVFYPAYETMTGKNGTRLVADSRLAHEHVKELLIELQGIDLDEETFEATFQELREKRRLAGGAAEWAELRARFESEWNRRRAQKPRALTYRPAKDLPLDRPAK